MLAALALYVAAAAAPSGAPALAAPLSAPEVELPGAGGGALHEPLWLWLGAGGGLAVGFGFGGVSGVLTGPSDSLAWEFWTGAIIGGLVGTVVGLYYGDLAGQGDDFARLLVVLGDVAGIGVAALFVFAVIPSHVGGHTAAPAGM